MTTIALGLGLGLALSHHKREPISARLINPTFTHRTSMLARLGTRIATDVEKMLEALNGVRAAKGLRPLALDPQLSAIANSHGVDMATRDYFDHDSPEGVSPFDRMKRANYRYGYAGENIALDSDPTSAHRAFLGSPEHRENMLESHYARVGIAAVPTDKGEYFVVDFSD